MIILLVLDIDTANIIIIVDRLFSAVNARLT
jgi:hypothetical protein